MSGQYTFQSAAHYDDWSGTVDADGDGQLDPHDYLRAKGLKKDSEFLAGIKVYVGEKHSTPEAPVQVTFLLAAGASKDEATERIEQTVGPIPLRKVEVRMPFTEFFALFKVFSMAFSTKSLLEGREFTTQDD